MRIAFFIRVVPFIMMRGIDKCSMALNFRELTREELRVMKRLAVDMCANYDGHYDECLLLDGACYMKYGVAYTCSALCNYFKKAVLPLNQQLEALFNGEGIAGHIKKCAVCGKELFTNGNRAKYCELCARRVHRRQKNESDRKRRSIADKYGSKKPVIMRVIERGSGGLNTFIPEPLNSASICPQKAGRII